MNEDVVQLFRMLIEAGAQPGEDFSCDLAHQSCHINERGFILLQNAYPQIDWHDFSKQIEPDLETPAIHLNQTLEIDFVGRILQRIESQLPILPKASAAWYVQQVLGGVQQRTGVSLHHFLNKQASPALLSLVNQLLQEHLATPCHQWIGDLIWAAGGTDDDFEVTDDDVLLSDRGIHLLQQVWAGEYELQEEDVA